METRSLTYHEIAAMHGIGVASARNLVRRKGWHKAPGNDGKARIRVPLDAVPTDTARPGDAPSDAGREVISDAGHDAAAHATAITTLARQITRLEAEADRLRAELDALRVVADAARQEGAAAATARQALAMQVEALTATLAAMTGERDRWQAAASRPLLARLFGRRAV